MHRVVRFPGSCTVPIPRAVALAGVWTGVLFLIVGLLFPGVVAASPGSYALVTNQFMNTVTVYDLCSDTPTEVLILSGGREPLDVAITPDGRRALVTNADDNTVTVIELAAEKPFVAATLPVGEKPIGVSISEDGTRALVCNRDDHTRLGFDTISVVSLESNPPVVTDTVPVGTDIPGDAWDAGIVSGGRYAIVAFGGSLGGYALTVDLTSKPPRELVEARIKTGRSPAAVGLNPARTLAVVPAFDDDVATVLDVSRFPFRAKGTVPVGRLPASKPAISRDGHAVVPNSGAGTVTIINAAADVPYVVATLPVGLDPRGVAIFERDNVPVAFIANRSSGTVSRLNLQTLTFLPPLTRIAFPNHIALHEGPCVGTDLGVALTASSNVVVTGSSLIYSIPVRNNGPSAANHVTVTVELPAETTLTACSVPKGGEWKRTDRGCTVLIPTLPVGPSEPILLYVSLRCDVKDSVLFTTTATVRSASPDLDPENNSAAHTGRASNPAPVIDRPSDIVRSNDPGHCGARVTFSPPAVLDNCPVKTVVLYPSSGSFFTKGVTEVTCTVTDAGGRTVTASFTVTVKDTEAPQVAPPSDICVFADPVIGEGLLDPGEASATDNCPGMVLRCYRSDGRALHAPFPRGITIVRWTASDASGNHASCIQIVGVL